MKRRGGLGSISIVIACALSACHSPTAQDVCTKVVARQRRCDTLPSPECEYTDQQNRCIVQFNQYRPDLLATLNNCNIDTAPCGSAGDTQLNQCVASAIRSAMSGGTYTNFVHALCNACPMSSGSASATTEQCVQTYETPYDPDAGSSGSNDFALLAILRDETVQPVTTCLQQISTSDPVAACSAAQNCLMQLSNAFGTLDAGPSACASDAAVGDG